MQWSGYTSFFPLGYRWVPAQCPNVLAMGDKALRKLPRLTLGPMRSGRYWPFETNIVGTAAAVSSFTWLTSLQRSVFIWTSSSRRPRTVQR